MVHRLDQARKGILIRLFYIGPYSPPFSYEGKGADLCKSILGRGMP